MPLKTTENESGLLNFKETIKNKNLKNHTFLISFTHNRLY